VVRFPSYTSGYRGPGSEQPSPTGGEEESRVARAKCIWNPARIPFSPFIGFPKIEASLKPLNDALRLPFSKDVSPSWLVGVRLLIP